MQSAARSRSNQAKKKLSSFAKFMAAALNRVLSLSPNVPFKRLRSKR